MRFRTWLLMPVLLYLVHAKGKIMSALTDLQDASKANTAAIADLAARVAALPQGGASDADIAAVTAELVAAKASLDAIATTKTA